jgi:hypothetical protein
LHGTFGNSPLFPSSNLDLSLQLISVDIPIIIFLLVRFICSVTIIGFLIFQVFDVFITLKLGMNIC